MKNIGKVALGIIATTTIATMGFNGVSAMGEGHGNGNGGGLGKYATEQEKEQLQSMSGEDRTEYMNKLKEKYNVSGDQAQNKGKGQGQGQGQGKGQGQKKGNNQGEAKQSGHNEDSAELIADVELSDVSEVEKELLINQYGEEKMARDLYNYASEKYSNINTFSNISKSEQKHMDTLNVLLERYNIEAPSDYAADNELYNTLKAKIDLSEKDAIEVGIMIEKVDIDNIVKDIKLTDNDDFKIIFTNIGGASYNHLRGFVKALDNAGYITDIDYSDYLTEDDINTKGPIKVKLAEKLEAEGVQLPEQATSKALKEKCDKEEKEGNHSDEYSENRHNEDRGSESRGKGEGNMNKGNKGQHDNSEKRTKHIEKKNAYKNLLNSKYKEKLDKFMDKYSTEYIEETLIPKIDSAIDKVKTSTTSSEEKKDSLTALLEAFKEIIIDRIEK